jgi:hypothetical protein
VDYNFGPFTPICVRLFSNVAANFPTENIVKAIKKKDKEQSTLLVGILLSEGMLNKEENELSIEQQANLELLLLYFNIYFCNVSNQVMQDIPHHVFLVIPNTFQEFI